MPNLANGAPPTQLAPFVFSVRSRCAASASCSSAPPASSARSRSRCCSRAIPRSARCSCWRGPGSPPPPDERFFGKVGSRRAFDPLRAQLGPDFEASCAKNACRSPATSRGRCCDFIGRTDRRGSRASSTSSSTAAGLVVSAVARGWHQRQRPGRAPRARRAPRPGAARARLDLLRRRQSRGRGVGRRPISSAISREAGRAPLRESFDPLRRRSRTAAHHRAIKAQGQRSRAHPSSAKGGGAAARRGPRRHDEKAIAPARCTRAQDVDGRAADRRSAWSARSTGAGPTPTRTPRRSATGDAPPAPRETCCDAAIVRPAIVESALRYPVPGLERGLHHHRAAGVPRAQGAPHLSRRRRG